VSATQQKWETVIGLEVHTQLSTASKIFSGAATVFGAAPNAQASAVDLALPGTLPVMNRGAMLRALRFGLAIGAKINRRSVFARKNYFYPDLPKGYQISQYELPIVEAGKLTVLVGDTEKTIRITRAHLEEDAGKSLHEDFQGMTGIDLNRAGTPLLEIVSEPDMRNAAEAVACAKALHALVRWIDICDGNMQEGSFRVDANVSVRPSGTEKLGTRCEIKNLNSFRFMEKAIEFEVRRQIELIEDGGKVVQETRLYDPDRDETRPMRSKEDAHDYRYFPDPDLLPLVVSEELLNEVRATLPELPGETAARFETVCGLTPYDARLVTSSKETAKYFEAAVLRLVELNPAKWLDPRSPDSYCMYGRAIAKAVNGILASKLNSEQIDIEDSLVSPTQLAALHARMIDGAITSKIAREIFTQIWDQGQIDGPAEIIDRLIEASGLKQVSDASVIEKIVDDVLAHNARQVADYKAGKEKAFNALVGQVMKATQGKANPGQVNDILKRKLSV
jgi:aspartyl-tRNA(Asn)/glutamyl-tRNA(Gln) amidotransferase subunit B